MRNSSPPESHRFSGAQLIESNGQPFDPEAVNICVTSSKTNVRDYWHEMKSYRKHVIAINLHIHIVVTAAAAAKANSAQSLANGPSAQLQAILRPNSLGNVGQPVCLLACAQPINHSPFVSDHTPSPSK